MFKNYSEARAYLEEYQISSYGLDVMRLLLNRLNNPEKKFKIAHIAGTNGKGSVSAYIAAGLVASGYKTGRYSSPAVLDELEIISVNGVNIEENDFCLILSEIAREADIIGRERRHPTRFEMETALAFRFFEKAGADIAIVEAGLGGRMDATNAIEYSDISVLTSISCDHTDILGDTIEQIAEEKAGIIKRNSLVVSAYQDSGAARVIEDKAREENSHLIIAGKGIYVDGDIFSQRIEYRGEIYCTRLIGEFQLKNLPVAIEALKALKERGFDKIDGRTIADGISAAEWRGRFQPLGEKPLFIIDGAHNDAASSMLAKSAEQYCKGKRIIFLMGIFKNKDYIKIAENTAFLADEIITFDWDNPRALCGKELERVVRAYCENSRYIGDIRSAVKYAMRVADDNTAIIAFGSLSHLKEIKSAYEEYINGRY